jgi:hypothetical protein
MDLWTTSRVGSAWSQPVKVPGVNTAATEGYPFLTEDGNQLWYTGSSKMGYTGPALFRCLKSGSGWGAAVEVVSNFAGECTMDSEGNLYFVHHYYALNMTMLEADIYVAYNKSSAGASSTASVLEDPAGPVVESNDGPLQVVSMASRQLWIASSYNYGIQYYVANVISTGLVLISSQEH